MAISPLAALAGRSNLMCVLLGVACSIATTHAWEVDADARPKAIIHLFMDDWGFGDVNSYKNQKTTRVKTPNLDQMAEDGTMFTHFMSASPVCSPSRAGWMASRFPAELGIHTALPCADCASHLDPSLPLVTTHLKKHGWATAHFGKWHLGAGSAEQPPPTPSDYGLDETATFNSAADWQSPDWPPLIPGCWEPRAVGTSCNDSHWAGHTATRVTDLTLDFIRRTTKKNASQPIYVNAWHHISHATLNPTDEQLSVYPFKQACRLAATAANQTTCAHQIFWASQTDADTQIGRMLQGLKTLGLYEDTLIVFSTDNGPEEPMIFPNGAGSTGPLRGRKRSLYDGGIRLPLIVHWPRGTPAGRKDASLIGGVDFLPTVATLTNLPLDPKARANISGDDVADVFRGITPERKQRDHPLFWEWRLEVAGPCWNEAPRYAVMDSGIWKLLFEPDPTNSSNMARLELYNRQADGFFEQQNRWDEHAEDIGNSLLSLGQAWATKLPKKPVAATHGGCGAYPLSPNHDCHY